MNPIDPLPRLKSDKYSCPARALTLVVYAPFGSDVQLSTYPDGGTQRVSEHPLYQALQEVANLGLNVCALIDRSDDNTSLVSASARSTLSASSLWKHDMGSPRSLASLLQHANALFPNTDIVLSLEGHGAGFLPQIDASQLTPEANSVTRGLGQAGLQRRHAWLIRPDDQGGQKPLPDDGQPFLPMTESTLAGNLLPGNHYPISTWGLGWALAQGMACRPVGDQRVAIVHFNNCFNFSTEVLHTIHRHAHYAVGYLNYNFFTAGRYYPKVFAQLAAVGQASRKELASWLATANANELAALPLPHPTVGGAIDLSRMPAIAQALDQLAKDLLASLPAQLPAITAAVKKAQRYDTQKPFKLVEPDSLTDLRSLAASLSAARINDPVSASAQTLQLALSQVKAYGASGSPYMAPQERWNFDSDDLAMNIFFPDPGRIGIFDWRTPFYMSKVDADPKAQPHVIDLLKNTRWVDFIRRYHEATVMVQLLTPSIPTFPLATFQTSFKS